MITRAPLTTILGLSIVASGCNVARIHARKCVGRLERNDYTHHTFTDGSGAHFVWYRDSGRKKILLLHGYTGTGALQWSRSAKLLGDDYDAIMPDLLCHGQSTKDWGDTPGGNIDAQVAHVRSILDSLGVDERIDVVGSSYGGGVAARFAELHPERVKKLVIYDGLVSDYTAAMADSIARGIGADGMLAVMGTPTAKDLRYGIKLSLYRNPPLPGFVLRQIHEVNVEPFRPAQITLIKDLMAHEPLFATKRYDWKMPVYLIWGERDELIPNATGRAIMKRNNIPEEHWTTIPRTGHVANIERPKAFDRALRKILAE
ncbi:MAG: alpha/beta hydrolase [Flavobacteriales bacterium]|nr:alpha/beta hydrolase [Flavobacteriales bacterium]